MPYLTRRRGEKFPKDLIHREGRGVFNVGLSLR